MTRAFSYGTLVLFILTTSSCTIMGSALGKDLDEAKCREKMSHQDYMNSFQTMNSVIDAFGVPTKREILNGREFYVYVLGNSATSRSSTRISDSELESAVFGDVYGSTITSTYVKYVQFEFDAAGNVRHWRTKGVDYGEACPSGRQVGFTILGLILDACAVAFFVGQGM